MSKASESIGRVPNERIEDLFKDAVMAKVGHEGCDLDVQEFDLAVRKELDQSAVYIDMTVFGMAGNTTKDDFAKKDQSGNFQVVRGAGSVSLTLDDDTQVRFVFSDIVNLNATDYMVTYRLA